MSKTKSALRFSAQVGGEPLEAKVMLAADPGASLSWLSALSRGSGAILNHAGIVSTLTSANTPAAATGDDAIVSDVFVSDLPEVATESFESTSAAAASSPETTTAVTTSRTLAATPAFGSASTSSTVQSVFDIEAEGETGDVVITIGQGTFVTYNSITGALRLDTGTNLTTLEIVSESGIFTGSAADNLGGTFDVDSDTKIFKLDINSFGSLSFGSVALPNLDESFVREDLTISGSLAGAAGGSVSNRQVKIEAFPTDLNGARLPATSTLTFGQEFLIEARVTDIRATSFVENVDKGVFAAYFDVTWDPDMAEIVGDIEFSDTFSSAQSGTASPGLLDEVGAVVPALTPTGPDAQTVFTLRLRAIGDGPFSFDLNPADVSPQHDVLVYGGLGPVITSEITYDGGNSITMTDTAKAPDLVAFAKALADKGVKFFGAAWCPHCTAQKELFEDGQHFLPFIEATNPDRTPNQDGIDNNITSYPTWVFPDGSRLEGEQTLQTLSEKAGVAIPQSNRPILIGLPETVDVQATVPMHVELDGYDPNNGPLTYTVTSSNPSIVAPTLVGGGRNLLIDVNGFGKMNFELFETEASRATEQIISLAEDGFYDDLTFHRILNNFVIQGGDPNGDGTGGSDLPDFDDQFDVDLQHNRTGILSMAKSADDTNNSQFFVTEGPTRWLDFNHTIFGQLVEGETNRDAISNTDTIVQNLQNTGRPTIPVVIDSVTVFNDTENNLLRLSAPEGATGTATITVTVADAEGHSKTETFEVTVAADDSNGAPFLADIPELDAEANTPMTYQLSATDAEDDPVVFEASTTSTNISVSVD
ncbi:MAG: peptidylprolyl isomerase, partial [Planctomycetales bacterium]|nr:peptidylprolyl isomerase [Planctomycetales bacterium]